ncbi:polyamine aminopropyltransferase, partial [Acidobacteriota bacterium]
KLLGEILAGETKRIGLGVMDMSSHDFDEGGCSAAVLISESHVCAHTWPEKDGLILVDVSTCNYNEDNFEKAKQLVARLEKALEAEYALVEHMNYTPRFAEKRLPGQGVWIEAKRILVDKSSPYQRIQVIETEGSGRTLILDGLYQIAEEDEVFYHEPLVHPPLLASDDPAEVMVIGGGDGGSLKHILLHPGVKHVDLVEIDNEVIEASKIWLETVHGGAFDDPRVHVRAADAFTVLDEMERKYDVIILDLTDPVGPCKRLFTEDFLSKVAGALKPGGFASCHFDFPICQSDLSRRAYEAAKGAFNHVSVYASFVPLYATLMCFGLLSNDRDPETLLDEMAGRLKERGLTKLDVISPGTIKGMFAIPPRIKKLLGIR